MLFYYLFGQLHQISIILVHLAFGVPFQNKMELPLAQIKSLFEKLNLFYCLLSVQLQHVDITIK